MQIQPEQPRQRKQTEVNGAAKAPNPKQMIVISKPLLPSQVKLLEAQNIQFQKDIEQYKVAFAKKDEAIQATKKERNLVINQYKQAIEVNKKLNVSCSSTIEESRKNGADLLQTREALKVGQKQYVDLLHNNNDLLSSINSTLSIAGGFAAGYVAYNNPAILLEFLKGLDYQVVQAILPYAQPIAGLASGLLGYAVSSYLGAPILLTAMKLVQGIDFILKFIVKGGINLSIALIKELMDGVVFLFNSIYEYRGTIGMLLVAGVVAYYNPELAIKYLFKATQMLGQGFGLAHSYASALLTTVNDFVEPYAYRALNGIYDFGMAHAQLPLVQKILNSIRIVF